MKLTDEKDVRRHLAEMVKKTLNESKRGAKKKLNESMMIGGMAPMSSIGVMGMSSHLREVGESDMSDPDLTAATQFAQVIADYVEDHVDEFANAFVMNHGDDGAYPARIEDIDEMSAAVARKVASQLNFEDLVKRIVRFTYKTALS